MNRTLLFSSIVIAIAAVSIGSVTFLTTQESDVTPMIIQPISASVVDVSLEQLEEVSDYAIVGKVLNITPVIYVDPDRAKDKAQNKNPELIILDKEILSDVKIKVEEDLFGKYNEKFITIRVQGGEIPGQKTIHSESTEFVKGERVIVFVGNGQSYSISDDNYTVMGLDQGTIRLGEEKVVSKFATDKTSEKEIKDKIKSLKKNKD